MKTILNALLLALLLSCEEVVVVPDNVENLSQYEALGADDKGNTLYILLKKRANIPLVQMHVIDADGAFLCIDNRAQIHMQFSDLIMSFTQSLRPSTCNRYLEDHLLRDTTRMGGLSGLVLRNGEEVYSFEPVEADIFPRLLKN